MTSGAHSRRLRLLALLLIGTVHGGCTCAGDPHHLAVDLKTDFVPGVEFAAVRVATQESRRGRPIGGTIELAALVGQDFVSGRRVAEYGGLEDGSYQVDVELLDVTGASQAGRRTILELRGNRTLTVVIARSCRESTCPGAGDDPAETACHGGRCVDPRCIAGESGFCGDPVCAAAADCPAPEAACAAAACERGVCLERAIEGGCAAEEWCDPAFGCRALFGSPDAGMPIDAGPGAWSPPARIGPIASTSNDDDPSMPSDMLELFFGSDRAGASGGGDCWVSVRDATSDPWGAPTPVGAINTTDTETGFHVSRDGLSLWFRRESGTTSIWVARRDSRGARWSAPSMIDELEVLPGTAAPSTFRGDLWMALASSSASPRELYLTSRTGRTAPWSAPEPIAELNTVYGATKPFVDEAGLAIFYSSQRPEGPGGWDLYVAERMDTSSPFGSPTPLSDLNTAADEEDVFLSDDGRTVLFVRNDMGREQIYESRR